MRRILARVISCAVRIRFTILEMRNLVLLTPFLSVIVVVSISLTGIAINVVAIVVSFVVIFDSYAIVIFAIVVSCGYRLALDRKQGALNFLINKVIKLNFFKRDRFLI